MSRLIAPLFARGNKDYVPNTDSLTRLAAPKGQLAMTGPSADVPEGHLPVRGDLAHIALAGTYFVPHYAAPMAHVAMADGAILRIAPRFEADEVEALCAGTSFGVLDIAGDWAWGQVAENANGDGDGDGGPVGYVAMSQLQQATV